MAAPTTRPQATCLATLAAGYGDGLSVALSNRGAVLLGGRVCPIVGRVCMDQLVVDCRDSRGIQEGDVAVLIGRHGPVAITAEDVAAASGSTNYEVVTRLLARVPRFYHRSQAPTSVLHPPNGATIPPPNSPRSPAPSPLVDGETLPSVIPPACPSKSGNPGPLAQEEWEWPPVVSLTPLPP